jgi:hypothetical protein
MKTAKTTPEQNKALVLEAFDTLFNKRDYDAASRFWSDTYIQHSAHIEPGRDGLFNLIRSAPDTLRYEHQLHPRGRRPRHRPRPLLGQRPARRLDRRGHGQDRGRPPRRTLGRLARRGDRSRIEKRPADVRRPLPRLNAGHTVRRMNPKFRRPTRHNRKTPKNYEN